MSQNRSMFSSLRMGGKLWFSYSVFLFYFLCYRSIPFFFFRLPTDIVVLYFLTKQKSSGKRSKMGFRGRWRRSRTHNAKLSEMGHLVSSSRQEWCPAARMLPSNGFFKTSVSRFVTGDFFPKITIADTFPRTVSCRLCGLYAIPTL